jgi:N-acetylglucosaminyldiphosphoundecaprenol N-acetyl-beta-D-mannosaminyltransferase
MTKQAIPIVEILSVPTHAQTLDDAIATLTQWAHDSSARYYVCTCPVYTLMVCHENDQLRQAINAADMIAADGMPIVWVQRRWGYPNAERVYGPDVMLELCRYTADSPISHFFLGGTTNVTQKLMVNLHQRFAGLRFAGTASPVIDDPAALDWALIERLNSANPSVIWVGLGSPKQDIWMHRCRPHLNAPLLIGVGAAFDFLSGSKPQAPVWMRRSGLEWLFRLAQEPRRLGRRYLVYNPRFVAGVLHQSVRRRFG